MKPGHITSIAAATLCLAILAVPSSQAATITEAATLPPDEVAAEAAAAISQIAATDGGNRSDDTAAGSQGAELAVSAPQRDIIKVQGGGDLYIENDALAFGQDKRTDRFYTNGLRLKFNSSQLRSGPVNAGPGIADKIINRLLRRSPYRHRAFVAGHQMYTPSDVTLPGLIVTDRPYAGWLYAGLVWTGFRPTEGRPDTASERRRDRNEWVELDLGVVGPLSRAEQIQREFHKAVGARDPKGWGNQLKNEPGIILSYQHNRRPLFFGSPQAFGLDVTTLAGGDAGNIFTQARLGATLRVGYNVPRDFHAGKTISPTLMGLNSTEPASKRGPGDGNEATEADDVSTLKGRAAANLLRKHGIAFYVFGGAEGRYVLRNIFLDGNTFRDSHSVAKRHVVTDIKLGGAAHFGKLRVSYTLVRRSPEFKLSRDRHQFGSFNIGWGQTF